MLKIRIIIMLSLVFLLFSCSRPANKADEPADASPSPAIPYTVPPGAPPLAIVQAGEFPLWFQFAAGGPELIETIEDAVLSAALVPWPLAPHARFMLAQGGDLLIAVNRDGILRFSPVEGAEAPFMGLYRYADGEFWPQYTVGAFALFEGVSFPPANSETDGPAAPAALLYHDDRFLDSGLPPPSPRLWTYDRFSGGLMPVPRSPPALDAYPPQDGWDIDVLRRGGDGYWYFRAIKKKAAQPELQMLRTGVLAEKGEPVSLGALQSAALPEPLSAAPELLQKILDRVFAESGSGIASVVSPEFQTIRNFAIDREKPVLFGFYSGVFLLAISPQGKAFYAHANPLVDFGFSLPSLPEGFAYTGIGMCGDTIIASWEEQAGYSIGAAGFMVIANL